MKPYKISILIIFFVSNAVLGTVQLLAQIRTPNEKLLWWHNAKFGMFVHCGLYSETAGYWNGHQAKGAGHFMVHEKIS